MKRTTKQYHINGSTLDISFRHGAVHIPNSRELKEYLSLETDTRTKGLISMIKNDYFQISQEALDITDDSMAVELWGHLFAQNFRPVLDKLSDFTLTEWLAERLIKSAEIIDLGEEGLDHNRKYWDWLSQHKSLILKLLF
jgi:hypothetical protein